MADNTECSENHRQLSPDAITDRLSAVSVGDTLVLNERDTAYEVVNVDRYSVTVRGPDGNRLSVAQNLQSGGWVINEDIWWVKSDETRARD